MLARAIAKSIGCNFNRIQFTPDMLPADLIGTLIYNQKTGTMQLMVLIPFTLRLCCTISIE
jgi:MoxR-like ATPase